MNESLIASRLERRVLAGEDWVVTDAVKHLVPNVVREIQRRGGQATGTADSGKIMARQFAVDSGHKVPLEIQIYEGTYSEGEAIVNVYFNQNGKHPLPIDGRQPFDAKKVVDSIGEAFMSLVNYKEASSHKASWGNRPFGDYLNAVYRIMDKKHARMPDSNDVMDYIAGCQEELASPEDCVAGIISGDWKA